MSLSIESLRPVSMIQALTNVVKSDKVNAEQTLLPQQKEGQLGVKEMANLIALAQTNNISSKTERRAQKLIAQMNQALTNGVTDANAALLSVVKDIATGKIDFNKVEKSPESTKIRVDGKDGKTYAVEIIVDDEKGETYLNVCTGTSEDIDKFIAGKLDLSKLASSAYNFKTEVLKALPQVYSAK